MNRELREAYRAYLQDPDDYPTIDNYARLLARSSRKPEHIGFANNWRKFGGGKVVFGTTFDSQEEEIMVLMVIDEELDERKRLRPSARDPHRPGLYDAIRYSAPWTPWVSHVTRRPPDSWERVPKSIYVAGGAHDLPWRARYLQEARHYVLVHPRKSSHPDNRWNSIYHGPVALYVTDFHGIPIDSVAPYDIFRFTSQMDDFQRSKWEIDVDAATELGLIYSDGENFIEPEVPAP